MTTQTQKPEGAAQIPTPSSSSANLGEAPETFTIRRPARVQLSPEETRARMEAFSSEREEAFVAAIREDES